MEEQDSDLIRSREAEQEVLDILDCAELTAPEGRGSIDY
jgi:hypothetical protein